MGSIFIYKSQNDSLSEINKFTYLKLFLSDSTKLTISGLSLSSENYKVAIDDLLKQRYGNTQVLINAFMVKFVKLPAVENCRNVKCFRFFYDQVKIWCTKSENFGSRNKYIRFFIYTSINRTISLMICV